jgi:hypothetical protein
MMFSSSEHLLANDKVSFFFVAEQNSTVYKYHIHDDHAFVTALFGKAN